MVYKFYVYVDGIEKDQVAFKLEESCSSSFLSENDQEVGQRLGRVNTDVFSHKKLYVRTPSQTVS